jgi:hypothetical protein
MTCPKELEYHSFIHYISFYLLLRRNGRLIMTAVIDKEAACA